MATSTARKSGAMCCWMNEDDRLSPVLGGEAARGHADDDGVVTGEHQVDQDNAEESGEEIDFEVYIHRMRSSLLIWSGESRPAPRVPYHR